MGVCVCVCVCVCLSVCVCVCVCVRVCVCVFRIRVSGIRGLQGVVRKTVDDELQVNIWEPRHMEQIVPALLVNLQQHTRADRYTHTRTHRQVTFNNQDLAKQEEGSWCTPDTR